MDNDKFINQIHSLIQEFQASNETIDDFLYRKFGSADDMILIAFVQLHEVAAPAPYAYDQVRIVFGVFLGVQKNVAVDGVEL